MCLPSGRINLLQMTVTEGRLVAPPREVRIGIVVARFNELVTERLLEGAVAALVRHGGDKEAVDVVRVPGAFELPVTASKMVQTGKYGAIICLGCVIKGATDHYDYVCGPTASGIMNVGINAGIPVLFGVLTTESLEQALDRAGAKVGNKGAEAMTAALEMADLFRQIG